MLLPQNYFILFGINVSPFVDNKILKQTFLALQKQFHPDKFVNQTNQDKQMASQMISMINDAYRVLKDIVLRCEYLLNLQTNNSHQKLPDTISDNDFLQTQINLHEQLAQISNYHQQDKFILKINKTLDDLLIKFSDNYQHNYQMAAIIVQKMQFFNRLYNQAAAKDYR